MEAYQQRAMKTMNSLDDVQRAVAKPYLFTRLQARISDEAPDSIWSRAVEFFSKPVTIAFMIVTIFLMNYFILNAPDAADQTMGQSAITISDYTLNVASYYNLENE